MRRITSEATRVFVWIALALVLALPAATGCGGASNGAKEKTTEVPPEPGEGAALGSKDEKGRGWRWKGKRDHCYYVFDNHCYEDKAAACKAAGCPDAAQCNTDDGAPAKVSCAK